MRQMFRSWIAAGLIVAAGCAASATRRTAPEDMSARAHRDEAERHFSHGQEARIYGYGSGLGYYGAYRWHHRWYPWTYTWEADHVTQAEEHLDAAVTLEEEHEAACALIPPVLESVSPIDAWIEGYDALDGGVVLHLAAAAGPPDILMQHLRCHRAWMALKGLDQMRECPLGVKGILVTVHASKAGVEVMLSTKDAAGAGELRRRAEGASLRHKARQEGGAP